MYVYVHRRRVSVCINGSVKLAWSELHLSNWGGMVVTAVCEYALVLLFNVHAPWG
jgi:hypothetical protein